MQSFFATRKHQAALHILIVELYYPAFLGGVLVRFFENIQDLDAFYIMWVLILILYFSISYVRTRRELQGSYFNYNIYMFGWDIFEGVYLYFALSVLVDQVDQVVFYLVSTIFMVLRNIRRVFAATNTLKKTIYNFIAIMCFSGLYLMKRSLPSTELVSPLEYLIAGVLLATVIVYGFHTSRISNAISKRKSERQKSKKRKNYRQPSEIIPLRFHRH